MKQFILSLGFVLAALCFIGTANAENPFTAPDGKYQINFPENWEVKTGVLGTDVIALSPTDGKSDQFKENINVVSEDLPRPMNTREYTDANLTQMQRMLKDFKVISQKETTIGNQVATEVVSTYRSVSGKLQIRGTAYFMVRDKKGYVITCSAVPQKQQTYASQFNETVASFRIK